MAETAPMTAWAPHSISVTSRTFGNAPTPPVLLDWMNAAVLASLSGTSKVVPSQGAVQMARTEMEQAQNPTAKSLAEKIKADQTAEISQMQTCLTGRTARSGVPVRGAPDHHTQHPAGPITSLPHPRRGAPRSVACAGRTRCGSSLQRQDPAQSR
ncbi:hypothetical protein GCM10022225_80050 [Plantactinospora mayteni]|uniref:DUF305 domain-containing protein n=1 Tax=Plantactinospora mayteni TaxID=566021 RepID=A0ABQ4F367_9ACTN|nr:DUF305 domain-containing protein [Plantactinospora mayteni]GIH01354.1 hypothetical protein Pma05_79260 [Plantactinospora mayteni]